MLTALQLRTLAHPRQLCEAEVPQVRPSLGVEQDVAGLHVAVHDLQRVLVGAVQGAQHVQGNGHRPFYRQTLGVFSQQVGQVAAGHVGHGQQHAALIRLSGVGGHDVGHIGLAQRGAHLHLAVVSPPQLLQVVRQQVAARLLEGHLAATERDLLRQPDTGHPALADELQNVVFAVDDGLSCG